MQVVISQCALQTSDDDQVIELAGVQPCSPLEVISFYLFDHLVSVFW